MITSRIMFCKDNWQIFTVRYDLIRNNNNWQIIQSHVHYNLFSYYPASSINYPSVWLISNCVLNRKWVIDYTSELLPLQTLSLDTNVISKELQLINKQWLHFKVMRVMQDLGLTRTGWITAWVWGQFNRKWINLRINCCTTSWAADTRYSQREPAIMAVKCRQRTARAA